MLSQRYTLMDLYSMLVPRSGWHPYPTVHERNLWQHVPARIRQLLCAAGEEHLGCEWPALPATLFLDYARTGARTPYQTPYYQRRYILTDLVLAECAEGQGRFLDDIVNGIWLLCEETYWGVPAHIWVQRAGNTLPDRNEPTVDLFAAETGALLAWTHYLLDDTLDTVSPVVRPRIETEIQTRILEVNRRRIDFPWQGNLTDRRVNNWNPWICSNWLTCLLAIETDPRARTESLHCLLQTLDRFLDPYPADGGCDEGPNYWGRAGASLYDNLELLYGATGGALDMFQERVIQEIGRFIYRAHIADDYYLNFADASAIVEPEAMLVYNYGKCIADPTMQSFGIWLAERQQLLTRGLANEGERKPSSIGRALPALFSLAEIEGKSGGPPLPQDVWLPQIEVMGARDEAGSTAGFYTAIKGGHNAESHNHNDIGNFVVYLDGKPLLADAGVEEYTAKTFGPQRYDIWTMQSAYHNLLPTINGQQQQPGENFQATGMQVRAEAGTAEASLDLAAAYGPEAGIESWVRTFTLVRGEEVRIEDEYRLADTPAELNLCLITPCTVEEIQAGRLALHSTEYVAGRTSAAGTVCFDSRLFQMTYETIELGDARMVPVWGTCLRRILFTARQPHARGRFQFRVSR